MEVNSPFSRFKQAVNILINNFANLLEFIPYINNNFIIIKITITNLFIVIIIFIIIIIIISIMSDYYQYYKLLCISISIIIFVIIITIMTVLIRMTLDALFCYFGYLEVQCK